MTTILSPAERVSAAPAPATTEVATAAGTAMLAGCISPERLAAIPVNVEDRTVVVSVLRAREAYTDDYRQALQHGKETTSAMIWGSFAEEVPAGRAAIFIPAGETACSGAVQRAVSEHYGQAFTGREFYHAGVWDKGVIS